MTVIEHHSSDDKLWYYLIFSQPTLILIIPGDEWQYKTVIMAVRTELIHVHFCHKLRQWCAPCVWIVFSDCVKFMLYTMHDRIEHRVYFTWCVIQGSCGQGKHTIHWIVFLLESAEIFRIPFQEKSNLREKFWR